VRLSWTKHNIAKHEGKWHHFTITAPYGEDKPREHIRTILKRIEDHMETGFDCWMSKVISHYMAHVLVLDERDAVAIKLATTINYKGLHERPATWNRSLQMRWSRENLALRPWHIFVAGEGQRDDNLPGQLDTLRQRLGNEATGWWMLHVQDNRFRAKVALEKDADIALVRSILPSLRTGKGHLLNR
jgi:hypothetical protein